MTEPKKVLKRLMDRVGGTLTISKRGVPYLRLWDRNYCYFGKSDVIRMFQTNPITGEETRIDYPNVGAILEGKYD